MIKTYNIEGMHCMNCVTKVKNALETIAEIHTAKVNLEENEVEITFNTFAETSVLQTQIEHAGDYTISEKNGAKSQYTTKSTSPLFSTYKPLFILLLYLFIGLVLFMISYPDADHSKLMRFFMGSFFLSFSFFKMLDISGFVNSFRRYDIVAKKSVVYAYAYPFIELLLAIAYFTNVYAFATNSITFLIMGIGLIGVVQAVLKKQHIQCACLGSVFNLPMSTVTIIENSIMAVMALIMLFQL